ncbi:hypothetical protein C0989_005232 [Termitomyces sp. Mn162]|nr:hypothetical protein C0989_005232 [Termitomyces sp. Mn162]
MATQVKQMRLIHKLPFSPQEIETFRQLVFDNLTRGMKYLLDAMEDMDLKVAEENISHVDLVENAQDLRDNEPFPMSYYEPLKTLWMDPNVQKAWERGNEAALPEKTGHYPMQGANHWDHGDDVRVAGSSDAHGGCGRAEERAAEVDTLLPGCDKYPVSGQPEWV